MDDLTDEEQDAAAVLATQQLVQAWREQRHDWVAEELAQMSGSMRGEIALVAVVALARVLDEAGAALT